MGTTKRIFSSITLIGLFFSLMGCSAKTQKDGIPALFDTKAQAEKAAKKFNCKGAHKMGEKWMPCKSHQVHEKLQKHGDHRHHHNH